jgi:hypothetical protein
MELGVEVLREDARRGEMVVWLRYGLADIGRDSLQIGDSITFYRRQWLSERLENGPRDELPPELREPSKYSSMDSLAGVRY